MVSQKQKNNLKPCVYKYFQKRNAVICWMSPPFIADFFQGSMKPKVKPASIPATDVPEQRLQHNGEVFSTTLAEFNVHGGWLEE